MDRRSGEVEILVADPAWALANVGKPAKQRAPQSRRAAEPEIAAAGRERRRADQGHQTHRVCRRLQLLSRMDHHEQDNEQVFP